MLWAELLHVTEHPGWSALRTEVRRFVARRARESDVDDLVQEVLVAIAGAESETRSPFAMAYGIARRTVADHHRRRAREHARLARVALEPRDDEGEPINGAEAALAAALAAFLDEITPAHAEAVRAVDVNGRRQADVARELGVPLSTLRARVQRGRQELRARVRRCCAIEVDRTGRVLACEPRTDADTCRSCG